MEESSSRAEENVNSIGRDDIVRCDKMFSSKCNEAFVNLLKYLQRNKEKDRGQYAILWTEALPVRGGPLSLGHRAALSHGDILLHQEVHYHLLPLTRTRRVRGCLSLI